MAEVSALLYHKTDTCLETIGCHRLTEHYRKIKSKIITVIKTKQFGFTIHYVSKR